MEMIMSTLVLKPGEVAAPSADKKPRLSLFQRLVAARERQAARLITHYLATQPEGQLLDLGLTANEIEALRRPARKWSSQ
jgi:hypothetical protein